MHRSYRSRPPPFCRKFEFFKISKKKNCFFCFFSKTHFVRGRRTSANRGDISSLTVLECNMKTTQTQRRGKWGHFPFLHNSFHVHKNTFWNNSSLNISFPFQCALVRKRIFQSRFKPSFVVSNVTSCVSKTVNSNKSWFDIHMYFFSFIFICISSPGCIPLRLLLKLPICAAEVLYLAENRTSSADSDSTSGVFIDRNLRVCCRNIRRENCWFWCFQSLLSVCGHFFSFWPFLDTFWLLVLDTFCLFLDTFAVKFGQRTPLPFRDMKFVCGFYQRSRLHRGNKTTSNVVLVRDGTSREKCFQYAARKRWTHRAWIPFPV